MDWFENNYAEFDMMGKGRTSKFHPRKLLLIDNFYEYMEGDIFW